jgi:hypothetical protein
MWPVIVRPRAEADLENARDWYEERREGLGGEFILAARLAIEKIRVNQRGISFTTADSAA